MKNGDWCNIPPHLHLLNSTITKSKIYTRSRLKEKEKKIRPSWFMPIHGNLKFSKENFVFLGFYILPPLKEFRPRNSYLIV